MVMGRRKGSRNVGKDCKDRKDRKDEFFTVRLTKEDRSALEYISSQTGKTRGQIVREGLKMQYELAKYQEI